MFLSSFNVEFILRITQLKSLITLAWPLYIALLTQMLMGVADTVMAGRYGTVDMAAVAIGASVINPIMFFIQGIAMALVPLVASLQSQKKHTEIKQIIQHGVFILFVLGICSIGLIELLPFILHAFGVTQDIYPIVHEYLYYLLLSMPAFAVYQGLRQSCEGLSITRPSMIIMVLGLIVNIPANAVFIYGIGPFPEMGGAGCGLATMIVWITMCIATLLYSHYATKMRVFGIFTSLTTMRFNLFKTVLVLGVPIAFTLLTEVTLFAIIALLLAPLGAIQVAAHQIALNFSSLVFMFPLSIGMATAIRVGYEYGAGEYRRCQHTIQAATILTTCVSIITATLTIALANAIANLYTSEMPVVELAISVLFLGALFQISDAIGVVSANALRGYKDTNWLFILSLISYWVLGLPIGYILALTDNWVPAMGVQGFWIGIIVGLTVGAIAFFTRIYVLQQKLKPV